MNALSPRNTPPEATRKYGQPVNLPGLALAGGALLGGGALAVSLRRRALRGGLAHATGTIDALRKDMAEIPPSIQEPLKNFMNGPTPVITHAASPTPEDWRAMQAHFSDISSRKAALQAGAYSRYPELESDLTSRLREGSIHDKFQEAFHHKDSVPNSLRHKYDQYLLATAKSSSADLGEILAADSLPFHPSTGSLNPTYTGIFKQSSLSLARQFLTKSAEDSRPQVKYVYPGDTNKVSGAIWGGMLGSWLGGGASPAWAAAGSLGGAAAGVGLQVYRDHRIDQGIREGWLQPSEVHRPTMLGRSTTGALAGGITGVGLSMIPGVRLKYAVPAAAALGAVLGASGTPRAQARFDRMPLISKQASADFRPVNPAALSVARRAKEGQALVKEANRLSRHIADNREKYPMSRLQELQDRGVLRSPAQYLEGQTKGTRAMADAILRRGGVTPDLRTYEARPINVIPKTNINESYHPEAQYETKVTSYHPGTGVMHADIRVPPLLGPSGNVAEDLRRLQDVKAHRHEFYEYDESRRLLQKHGPNIGLDKVPRVYSHVSPAVLARESLDRGHDPYDHIVPPAMSVRQVIKSTQKGDLGIFYDADRYSMENSGTHPLSLANSSRQSAGETNFVTKGLGIPWAESRPKNFSNLLSKARRMAPDVARQVVELSKPSLASKIGTNLSSSVIQLLGSKGFRR